MKKGRSKQYIKFLPGYFFSFSQFLRMKKNASRMLNIMIGKVGAKFICKLVKNIVLYRFCLHKIVISINWFKTG